MLSQETKLKRVVSFEIAYPCFIKAVISILSINFTAMNCLYLRNLLTHTVNNLLQTLNNVKSIQFLVVKQKFNIIHIICENFKTIPWVLCKIQHI